jgi:hypothetical protein
MLRILGSSKAKVTNRRCGESHAIPMRDTRSVGYTLVSGIVKLDERIDCMRYSREQTETENASGEHDGGCPERENINTSSHYLSAA